MPTTPSPRRPGRQRVAAANRRSRRRVQAATRAARGVGVGVCVGRPPIAHLAPSCVGRGAVGELSSHGLHRSGGVIPTTDDDAHAGRAGGHTRVHQAVSGNHFGRVTPRGSGSVSVCTGVRLRLAEQLDGAIRPAQQVRTQQRAPLRDRNAGACVGGRLQRPAAYSRSRRATHRGRLATSNHPQARWERRHPGCLSSHAKRHHGVGDSAAYEAAASRVLGVTTAATATADAGSGVEHAATG